MRKKVVTPSERKREVKRVVEKALCSERRACQILGISRSAMRYKARRRPDEQKLIKEIKALKTKHKRYGCRRITAELKRDSWTVNYKRVHRIWKQEGWQVPSSNKKKRPSGQSKGAAIKAESKNHVWAIDFVEVRTERGQKVRIFEVIDEFTRECLWLEAATSFPSMRVCNAMEWLFLVNGSPEFIRSDNGSEFIAKTLKQWMEKTDCRSIFINPGCPWENGFVESFNGKLRDECLNMEIFVNLKEVQMVLDAWKEEYNEHRPHSSLGYLTPKEFAQSRVDCAAPDVSCGLLDGQPTIGVNAATSPAHQVNHRRLGQLFEIAHSRLDNFTKR